MDCYFRQAAILEGKYLTELALRSKSYWGYSKNYLNQCRPALTIDQNYIMKWPVIVLETSEKCIGFYSLKEINGENRLDNLWIDLSYIGYGYGEVALKHSFESAKKIGWKYFRLASEPKAEGFYFKYGAKKLGVVQSKIKPDLFLPHLEIVFSVDK